MNLLWLVRSNLLWLVWSEWENGGDSVKAEQFISLGVKDIHHARPGDFANRRLWPLLMRRPTFGRRNTEIESSALAHTSCTRGTSIHTQVWSGRRLGWARRVKTLGRTRGPRSRTRSARARSGSRRSSRLKACASWRRQVAKVGDLERCVDYFSASGHRIPYTIPGSLLLPICVLV